MAGSEMREDDGSRAVEDEVTRYADQASVEVSTAQAAEGGPERPWVRRLGGYRTSNEADRARLIKQARETEFPIAVRGYARTAVDRYVMEVNRLIAELEMTSSPEAAVRRALEEVSEETRGLLERAHQTAEDIAARSRMKADDRLRQAEEEAAALRRAAQEDAEGTREAGQRDADGTREAAQREADSMREAAQREARELRAAAQHESANLREMATREVTELRETATGEMTELREMATREAQQTRAAAKQAADRLLIDARREAEELLDAAETRARELAQNAEAIWRERRRLVDDMRAIGEQLSAVGEAEAKRFPTLNDAIPGAAVPSRAASAETDGGAESSGAPRQPNGGSDPGVGAAREQLEP